MLKIQRALAVPKEKNAGRYKYRSADDIYEKVKPLLESELSITTSIKEFSGRFFLEAEVGYKNSKSVGYAELEKDPKNMSIGQATGAATSYAIKYALCMLFCIGNGEDLDGQEAVGQEKPVAESVDKKRLLHSKMVASGLTESEMKAFYQTYCTNDVMRDRVLEHFDRFLNEWRTSDKERIMKK